jgi:uncharacterized protein
LRSIEFGQLRIPLASVKQGRYDFDFQTTHPDLSMGGPGASPSETIVHAHVTPLGEDFLVELSAETTAVFVCDRCGEAFSEPLHGQVKVLFISPKAGVPAEEDDEVRLLSEGAQFIDLFQDAKDALVLAVPMRKLCRESCKGLCPQCGKNLNEGACACAPKGDDSPWDALKNVRFDE